MSRSGYCEDFSGDEPQLANLYRASVARSIRGKRGQAFLREMAAALDAMPVKELVAGDVVTEDKCVCAMGSVALARGLDVSTLDVTDGEDVAKVFGVAPTLAREIAFENDDDFGSGNETRAQRWTRMRKWVDRQLARAAALTPGQGGKT